MAPLTIPDCSSSSKTSPAVSTVPPADHKTGALMPRMTAARAAVEILKREGVVHAFGLPGAAINPFYHAMRESGGIDHVLARHVAGASHMGEGYTRAAPGNIGG